MDDDRRRVVMYGVFTRNVLATTPGALDITRRRVDEVGWRVAVAVIAAGLTADLLRVRHDTDAVLSGGMRTPEAVELALACSDHVTEFVILIAPLAALAAVLDGSGDSDAVISRMENRALVMHDGELGDCPPDRWPTRLAALATELIEHALGPDLQPGGDAKQRTTNFLVDVLGAALLGCAACTPQPDHADDGQMEDLAACVEERTAAEPLALDPVVEGNPLMSDLEVAAVEVALGELTVEVVRLEDGGQPTTMIPALTRTLSVVAQAAQGRRPPPQGTLEGLAATAAGAAAGIEVELTGRPATGALTAVRAAVRCRALGYPHLVGGPVMRHSTLTQLTGEVAARAGEIAKYQVIAADRDQVVAWQGLRDCLVGLASACVQAIAAEVRDAPSG